MRAVTRALLSRYPLLAVAVVASRWVAMTLVGFPVGALIAAAVASTGFHISAALVVAVLGELIATGLALTGVGGAVARYVGWRRACRFRCRWPSLSAEIGASAFRNVSVVMAEGANYSGPEGFRPILASPRLSTMPITLRHNWACWEVRPTGHGSFDELERQIKLLPLIDDRIADAALTRQPRRSSRWLLWIVFCGYVETGRGESPFEPPAIDVPSGPSSLELAYPPSPSASPPDDGHHHRSRHRHDPHRRYRSMFAPADEPGSDQDEGDCDEA